MSRLLDAAGDAPFIFVVGKGGTGKTTTAGALALEIADTGTDTHLISTDPAHSLGDLFQHGARGHDPTSDCSPHLTVEEFDAPRAADDWIERSLGAVTGIIERGTYLDGDDVAAFSRLALPGIDEMMAVLRICDLIPADNGSAALRIVVDTAPTGHTLRLLDAAHTHAAIARALRAMADKATAVAHAMTGRAIRMRGENLIDRLEQYVLDWHERVLAPAAFIVTTRPGRVVEAETVRLGAELEQRHLRIAASLSIGATTGVPHNANVHLCVSRLRGVAGCDALRTWRQHVGTRLDEASGPGPVNGGSGRDETSGPGPEASAPGAAGAWLETAAARLLLFAGKGGTGKSTCAAAAALALAETRDILLCSTDPAGSLADVLGTPAERPAERLRVVQVSPAEQLSSLGEEYREEAAAALERLGVGQSAVLDRRVVEALWDLAPPGLDELAGVVAMLRAAEAGEMVVIDTAPTGHFLRLLEMPEIALAWTRQVMRIFVKYGISGAAGKAAESLIELSRDLRGLRDTLRDPLKAAVVIVTLDEPMVRAESERLAASLSAAEVRIAAVLVNRSSVEGRGDGHEWPVAERVIAAPTFTPPLTGTGALREFGGRWKIVR